MEHSYFNLMLYLFQEDCKQPEGYTIGLLNIHIHANPRETKSGRESGVCHASPPPPLRKLFFRRTQNGAFCCILDIKSVQSNL